MPLLPQLDALWHIGIVRAPIARFVDPAFEPQIEWLPRAPVHEYYADPFALQSEQGLVVICEAYDYTRRKGRLVELREQAPGSLQFTRRTLHAPAHHVSFPCPVHDDGRVFCVPEQGATGRTSLLELDLARGRVSAEHIVLDAFGAADPVLFRRAGLWWLFVLHHAALPRQELHVFFAESLLGPYHAHRHNPLSRDGSHVRAAGLPFEADGRWYRPVQDGSARYGGALALLEIVSCSPELIEEHVVRRLVPSDPLFGLGFHTLSAAGPITLVDGLRPSRVPPICRALAGVFALPFRA